MTCGHPCGLSCLCHWSHHHPCLRNIMLESGTRLKKHQYIYIFIITLSVRVQDIKVIKLEASETVEMLSITDSAWCMISHH